MKEKSDKVRRQIEMLNSLKTKIDQIQKERSDFDRKNGLTRDAQVTFDKYLRLYAKDSKTFKRQKRNYHVEEKVELASFKQKWAEYLTDE